MRPPERVHLPSGRALSLAARTGLRPRIRARAAPLFSEAVELFASGDVALSERGQAVDVLGLELRDFHALRAIATQAGWLAEEPAVFACRNCGDEIVHAPCAALELGPFVDGELDDPELDRTLDSSREHPIPEVLLDSTRVAREVKLGPLRVGDALPLHRALRRRRLVVSDRVVRAMGIESLGPERDAGRIAGALSRCTDEAWAAIGDLFLEAHYPLRLGSIAICAKCGARNDVDAPFEREFEPSGSARQSNTELFPDLDAFDARARALFERYASQAAEDVRLVVDAQVPACDEGGEPLLGSYVPPGGDVAAPVGLGEVAVYYRTFRAVWDEEGPYDWEAELAETIEHEIEHHSGWRVGHDPMDDEEHAAIERERAALVGRRETGRQTVSAFGADVGGFIARTWPIWLIVAVVTTAITVCGH